MNRNFHFTPEVLLTVSLRLLKMQLDPDVMTEKFVPCWSLGGRYRHLTGPAGVGLWLFQGIFETLLTLSLPHPVQTGPWPTYLKKPTNNSNRVNLRV
jgi:hypothetical protein